MLLACYCAGQNCYVISLKSCFTEALLLTQLNRIDCALVLKKGRYRKGTGFGNNTDTSV